MAENRSEEPKAAPPEESLTKKLLYGLGGLVLVPLVGAVIGSFFQERSWSNENRTARIDADMRNAQAIGSKVATLTNERYAALLQLVELVDRQGTGREAWAPAYERFLNSEKEWEVGFSDAMSQLKFYVDTPFGIGVENPMQEAAPDDCTKMRGERRLDMSKSPSAAYLLAALNNCYGQVHEETIQAIADKEKQKSGARRPHLENASAGLRHIWYVNAIFSCEVDGRVLAIHKALNEISFIYVLFGAGVPNPYRYPEHETDCLDEYEAWRGVSEAEQDVRRK